MLTRLKEQSELTRRRKVRINDLYPTLSSDEQAEAARNLKRYIALIYRIYQRLKRENPKALTEIISKARLKKRAGDHLK